VKENFCVDSAHPRAVFKNREFFTRIQAMGSVSGEKVIGGLFLCLLLIIVSSLPFEAPGQEFLWTKLLKNAGVISPAIIALDADGNSYVTGSFYGTASFGNTNLTWIVIGVALNCQQMSLSKTPNAEPPPSPRDGGRNRSSRPFGT